MIMRVCERTVWTCCLQLCHLHMHYISQALPQILEQKRDYSESSVQESINTIKTHLHLQLTTPAKLYELALGFILAILVSLIRRSQHSKVYFNSALLARNLYSTHK